MISTGVPNLVLKSHLIIWKNFEWTHPMIINIKILFLIDQRKVLSRGKFTSGNNITKRASSSNPCIIHIFFQWQLLDLCVRAQSPKLNAHYSGCKIVTISEIQIIYNTSTLHSIQCACGKEKGHD